MFSCKVVKKQYLGRVRSFITLPILYIVSACLTSSCTPSVPEASARFTLNVNLGRQPYREPSKFEKQYLEILKTQLKKYLEKSSTDFEKLLGLKTQEPIKINLLSPSKFQEYTGAPPWTSAMYFKSEISIPIDTSGKIDFEELRKSIKHEYLHALIAETTYSKCPAWLDEGLAQIYEGIPNPVIAPALKSWLKTNQPFSLTSLENGFTTLDEEFVPAAYGQSYFYTKVLLKKFGIKKIKDFLLKVRDYKIEVAFQYSFEESLEDFERKTGKEMLQWTKIPRAKL